MIDIEKSKRMDYTITTDRLFLRPINESDISFFHEFETRSEYFEYDRDMAQSKDEIAKVCLWFIEKAKALPTEGAIRWIIVNDKAIIGEVHINCNWEESQEWEIGWHLLPEYWGKGYATEATKAVIGYSFLHFKIHRLITLCCTENVRSVALAERVGMVRDGRMRENKLIKGVYYDEYVYSILRHEAMATRV